MTNEAGTDKEAATYNQPEETVRHRCIEPVRRWLAEVGGEKPCIVGLFATSGTHFGGTLVAEFSTDQQSRRAPATAEHFWLAAEQTVVLLGRLEHRFVLAAYDRQSEGRLPVFFIDWICFWHESAADWVRGRVGEAPAP